MTTTRITMPQLGETVTEGTIVRWFKQPGDPVEVDEALFDVSTDKVDAEVPSAVHGVVREIHVVDGEAVPVGTVLGIITSTADEPFAPGAAEPAASAAPERAATPASAAPGRGAPTATTAATGAGPAADRPPADRVSPAGTRVGRQVLSPAVRALVAEHGLDVETINGSGRDGRITRADVLAAGANAGRPGPTAVAAPPSSAQPGPDDEVIPFSAPRRVTADNLARSVATAAHALVVVDVDYSAVEDSRATTGLTYLPYVASAVLDGIASYPQVNASVVPDALVVHHHVALGFAVDLGREALVVPALHRAADLRLRPLGAAIVDLADRARRGRLRPDELSGGTFTITTIGSYGTVSTAPIINPPQVAIVAVDAVKMRPVAVPLADGGWGVAVRPVGNLSLSFDHRAFDGAYAAAFLAHVRERLEHRDWTAEH